MGMLGREAERRSFTARDSSVAIRTMAAMMPREVKLHHRPPAAIQTPVLFTLAGFLQGARNEPQANSDDPGPSCAVLSGRTRCSLAGMPHFRQRRVSEEGRFRIGCIHVLAYSTS